MMSTLKNITLVGQKPDVLYFIMTWLDNQIKNLEETRSEFKEEIKKLKKIYPEIEKDKR